MNAELDKIRERITQQRQARNTQIADALDAARQAARTAGVGALPGDRVFDPESGQRGIIVGTTTEVVHVPTPERADG